MARPRQVSDAELISAARKVFLQHGPGASTQVIADAVGLSQAALFKRFGTKQGLMFAALLPPHEIPWVVAAEEGPGDGPIRPQLVALLRKLHAFVSEYAPCFSCLHAAGIDPRKTVLARFAEPPPKRGHRALSTWLAVARDRGGVRDLDCDAVATLLMGSMQGAVMLGHMFGVESGDGDYVETVVDGIWSGIAPREGA